MFPQVDKMLAEDIAKLMNAIPVEEQTKRNEGMDRIEGGAFEGVMDKQTPFQVRLRTWFKMLCFLKVW